MKRIAILEDPAIRPLPSYTAADARRALEAAGFATRSISLSGMTSLDRAEAEVLVLPYLDGDLSGSPLEGMIRFHAAGGGLLFLGDTPHVGRSFPLRNSQAPDLRMTRCRDPLKPTGLTAMGRKLLGDLPALGAMLGRSMTGLRVSTFPPDECHNLFACTAGFKELSPVVFIERKHEKFLGARAAVVGFDGGEPRENLMGVCNLPWKFDPGMLTRDWAGADIMVARLAEAVRPPKLAMALDFDPVAPLRTEREVSVRIRNLSGEPCGLDCEISTGNGAMPLSPVVVGPYETRNLKAFKGCFRLGPTDISVVASNGSAEASARRTHFCFDDTACPPMAFGFSVFRVFRSRVVDEAYKDFVRSVSRLGMQYVRMALAWEDLEPEPGRYVWDIPDQLLDFAGVEEIPAFFWVFPTARGSGLGEGGVPEWSLREPSIDRDGKPGNFPCIWSPFYRERYFAFLDALAARYAGDPRLARFVFDFGNSDFPYTYHYYGDRGDLFDYSQHEQAAFARWLESRAVPLEEIGRRWGRAFASHDEVPVPFSEQREAWLLYDEFRMWGLHQGVKEAVAIIRRRAPDKAPPDFPGHGIGSIADLGTYVHHAQAKRWDETLNVAPALTEAHNMGPQWGGEPWQVGGRFSDYDDALFQSVRLEADYLTIPGPDLGVWEDDIARVAMIRRTIAGAVRAKPRLAIMDRMSWNDYGSLAQVGSRLDQPVDLISKTCRYDYSDYRLVVLPPDEVIQSPRGPTSLLPLDAGYYEAMLEAVRNGLKVLIFPATGFGDPLNPMRRIFGLEDLGYGPRTEQSLTWPASWGGGTQRGCASVVRGSPDDEVLLRNADGDPLALFRPCGAGGFILAGYDSEPDSLDTDFRYDTAEHLRGHTLVRLTRHLELRPEKLTTGEACCYKEYLFGSERDFLLFYNHRPQSLTLQVEFQSDRHPRSVVDLPTGRKHQVLPAATPGWFYFAHRIPARGGSYMAIE